MNNEEEESDSAKSGQTNGDVDEYDFNKRLWHLEEKIENLNNVKYKMAKTHKYNNHDEYYTVY